MTQNNQTKGYLDKDFKIIKFSDVDNTYCAYGEIIYHNPSKILLNGITIRESHPISGKDLVLKILEKLDKDDVILNDIALENLLSLTGVKESDLNRVKFGIDTKDYDQIYSVPKGKQNGK